MSLINNPSISYRKISKKELSVVFEAEKKLASNPFYYAFTDEKSFTHYIEHSKVFVILENETVVGYCSYEIIDKESAELNGMVVLPNHQKKGLGTFAMKVLQKEMKNIKRVKLFVHPKNNIALGLYLKFGFTIEEYKENCFNGQPRLIMYKLNL